MAEKYGSKTLTNFSKPQAMATDRGQSRSRSRSPRTTAAAATAAAAGQVVADRAALAAEQGADRENPGAEMSDQLRREQTAGRTSYGNLYPAFRYGLVTGMLHHGQATLQVQTRVMAELNSRMRPFYPMTLRENMTYEEVFQLYVLADVHYHTMVEVMNFF